MNIAMILIDGLISIYCFAKNQKMKLENTDEAKKN